MAKTIKPEVVRRRIYNKLHREFRAHVEDLYKRHKKRPEYLFINYAIYLIWDDEFVADYIMNCAMDNVGLNKNWLGTQQQFADAIKIFNIGRNTNVNNRADGIDPIDKSLLIDNFNLVLKSYEEQLMTHEKELLNLKELEG